MISILIVSNGTVVYMEVALSMEWLSNIFIIISNGLGSIAERVRLG